MLSALESAAQECCLLCIQALVQGAGKDLAVHGTDAGVTRMQQRQASRSATLWWLPEPISLQYTLIGSRQEQVVHSYIPTHILHDCTCQCQYKLHANLGRPKQQCRGDSQRREEACLPISTRVLSCQRGWGASSMWGAWLQQVQSRNPENEPCQRPLAGHAEHVGRMLTQPKRANPLKPLPALQKA